MPATKEVWKPILITAILILALYSGTAQSNWTVERQSNLSQDIISPQTPTIQFLNITADVTDTDAPPEGSLTPTPLKEPYLDEYNITYTYNKTNGSEKDLRYWKYGKWYAEMTPNKIKGGETLFSANGTIGSLEFLEDVTQSDIENSTQEANMTHTFELGNYTLSQTNDLPSQFKAGATYRLDVAVRNASDNSVIDEDNASVSVYFQNWSQDNILNENLGNYEDSEDEFIDSEVSFPSKPDSQYLMQIVAKNNTGHTQGTYTDWINTAPALKGELTTFNSSSGCSNQTMVAKCEHDTNITAVYQVTQAEAQNVNLTLNVFNKTDNSKKTIYTENMTDKGTGYYQSEINLPDINTSKYKKKYKFVFNASNNLRKDVSTRTVHLDNYKTEYNGDTTPILGNNYDLIFFIGKRYSLESYTKERFNSMNITVQNPDGTNFANLTKENISYSGNLGQFNSQILLEDDDQNGPYTVQLELVDKYGEQITDTFNPAFNPNEASATFTTDNSIEQNIDSKSVHEFNVSIENALEVQNNLEINITEGNEYLNLIDDSISLSGSETGDARIEAQLDTLNNQETEIQIFDNANQYNQTVNITLNTPECKIQEADLCSTIDEFITSTDVEGSFIDSFEIDYIGESNSTADYESRIEGEVGRYITLQEGNETISIGKNEDIVFNITPSDPGTYTGSMQLTKESTDEEFNLPLILEYKTGEEEEEENESENGGQESTANQSFSFETDEEIELGDVVGEESKEMKVNVENTGEATITGFSVSSSDYTVSITSDKTLESGNSKDVNILFSGAETSEGEIQLTGSSESNQTTKTISVTANPVEDYEERANELQSELESLNPPADLQKDKTDAGIKIENVKTAMQNGNYEKAENLYDEAQTTVNRIEAQNEGGEETGGENEEENSSEQGGGGSAFIIIFALVFVMLLGGFVFYTSYIPEEGDPLYSVLGEDQ